MSGLGETPYIRLITQTFRRPHDDSQPRRAVLPSGRKLAFISVHGKPVRKGAGLANSLFEDNAEYGYGMYLGVKQIRKGSPTL